MPIRATSADSILVELIRTNIERTSTVRRLGEASTLRVSPLFEVRSPTLDNVAAGDAINGATALGWWAFLLLQEDVVGIVELTLIDNAVIFGGINTGDTGREAAAALRRAEEALGDAEGYVWFVRIAPLFFTAVIVEGIEGRILIPVGARSSRWKWPEKELAEFARKRMSAAQNRGSRPQVDSPAE